MNSEQLSRACKRVLTTYPEPMDETREWEQRDMLEEIVSYLREVVSEEYTITRSRTTPLPYIPAVGISHPRTKSGMRFGLNIVFLFDVVAGRLCLTLSQGIETAKQIVKESSTDLPEEVLGDKVKNHLECQSKRLRELRSEKNRIYSNSFEMKRLYFDKSLRTSANDNYGIAVVGNGTYTRDTLEESSPLEKDVTTLLDQYNYLVRHADYEEILYSPPSYDMCWYDRIPHRSSKGDMQRVARVEHIESRTAQFEIYDFNPEKTIIRHVGSGFSNNKYITDSIRSAIALRVTDPGQTETQVRSSIGNRAVGVTQDFELEQEVQAAVTEIASRHGLNWRNQ